MLWIFSANYTPPPPHHRRSSKFNSSHVEANSSLIGECELNSLARELEQYAAYYFAYPLWCVGGVKSVGGGGRRGGEINGEDPI